MPRRKQVAASDVTPKKRELSPARSTTSRLSKRIKSSPAAPAASKTTPRKSQFFAHESSASDIQSGIENEESGYEDEDASVSEMSTPPESDIDEEEEEEEDEYISEDSRSKKRKAGRQSGQSVVKVTPKSAKGQELWRPGVKADLAPGEAIFIKLPKAREAGKTPYKDDTVHPNTMLFLQDLKENNDREWLKVHDADYRQSQRDFNSFVDSLTGKIVEKDETIPELPHKDLTFRIYRDIRFSPDPTPYKTHFSAAWSRTGRKGPYAAYYVQIQPGGGSFVGCGLWHPDAEPVALLRRDFDRKSHKLKNVLRDKAFRKELFNGVPDDERKVVKAFVELNKENMLKTKPKGYDAENPNIALLRLRNYTIGRKLKDSEVTGPGALNKIVELIGIMAPFVTYLNSVIMPDEEPSSDDDDDDDEEEPEQEEE